MIEKKDVLEFEDAFLELQTTIQRLTDARTPIHSITIDNRTYRELERYCIIMEKKKNNHKIDKVMGGELKCFGTIILAGDK